jgi:hypothetical protein
MPSSSEGWITQASPPDMVLPSAMGVATDSSQFNVLVDSRDATDRVSLEVSGLDAALRRTRELIDSGELWSVAVGQPRLDSGPRWDGSAACYAHREVVI